MGYCINVDVKKFKIKKENADKVVEALKDFAINFTNTYDNRIAWVNKNVLIESESIEDSFEEIRYPLILDEDGDYTIDYFSGEKLGDDWETFRAIAPYVEDGSCLEVIGEDGTIWRWIFKDGQCDEKYPKVEWN